MVFRSKQVNCILPNSFFEGRFIPSFHPESHDARQWWDAQVYRCKHGFSDGGHSVTGKHYFHMNFREIKMVDTHNLRDSYFPYFSDSDQEIFNELDLAQQNGQGFFLITGRGWGKSYVGSTVADYDFTFVKKSEVVISASISHYADKLWAKCIEGLYSLPDALRPTLLVERNTELESGWIERINGTNKRLGSHATMVKVVYDDIAGKTRGGRPNIHIFDEVGSWKNFLSCYNISEASWWVGDAYICLPIILGTGGEMKSGKSEGAKQMFYNPERYNMRSVTLPDREVKTCYFIPTTIKFGGTYEETGISNQEKAKEFLERRRDKKKEDTETYNQEIQEFPFTPEEAFLVSGTNTFPTAKLNKQLSRLNTVKGLKDVVQRGDLEWEYDYTGAVITGVSWTKNSSSGKFLIKEKPQLLNGVIPKHLYISGCDSYDSIGVEDDKGEDDRSRGSIFMYKRILNPLDPIHSDFVAECTIRELDSDDFYEATAKLNYYYNSQMLYEHSKVGIVGWYIRNHLTRYLYPKPELAYEKAEIISSKSNNKYGLAMPIQIKRVVIDEYVKWTKANSQKMYFEDQILDAINYRWTSSKHDRTMAAGLAITAANDLFNVEVKTKDKNPMIFPVYNKQGGVINFK